MSDFKPKPNPQDLNNTQFRGYDIMARYVSRFHSKYSKVKELNGCWNWSGSVNRNGVPTYLIGKHGSPPKNLVVAAYKFSYVLHYGNSYSNVQIRRTCGNRRCVNPNHFIPYGLPEEAICAGCGKEMAEDNLNERCLPCTIQDWVERSGTDECPSE